MNDFNIIYVEGKYNWFTVELFILNTMSSEQ